MQAAAGYTNIEYRLTEGIRGSRHEHAGHLLAAACGAEAGIVVNNNAAAIVLVLATLARGRDVIVSRGELVEIGGGFRVPEILAETGARLVEVGTTNRTRRDDYERACNENTALAVEGARVELPDDRLRRRRAGRGTRDARPAGGRRRRLRPARRGRAVARSAGPRGCATSPACVSASRRARHS